MVNDNPGENDKRLSDISELISQFVNSDFNTRISLSGKGDEIDVIIGRLNVLGEKLASNSIRSYKEEKRINEIVNILVKYVCMDFSEKILMSGENDELDAVILGLNTLSEELETNIRQLKEKTTELSESNSALEAFSYSVSHDLRAPIRSVISFIQIIKRNYSTGFDDELKGLFEIIEKSAFRMNAIIDDLLALSKSDKKKLSPVLLDMKSMVKGVWDNIPLASPDRATLHISDLPDVVADASMIEQVWVNLLSNAVKYSSKKPEPVITVGFERGNGVVTFFVKDNGAGFDMKNYDRLFGAFQRLHTASEFEGTGVGLTIVKRIIKLNGGSVWAEGKVNEGATFYFTLPFFAE